MYINRVELENIKCFEQLVWELPDETPKAGWHVIIGDNASGKSSMLRCIALALIGFREAFGLRYDERELVRTEHEESQISISFILDDEQDQLINLAQIPDSSPDGFQIIRQNNISLLVDVDNALDAPHQVWGKHKGWFSASFGPMRRFSGGDKDHDRLFATRPKLAAHLSLFGEDVALTEIGRWLQRLQLQNFEGDAQASALLEHIKAFINQPGLMPQQTRLEKVSSEGIMFIDSQGHRVTMDQLSDGFRSILSLTLELIRQLSLAMPASLFRTAADGQITIDATGVVLIDEVDAHLHPSWQQEIGWWFQRHFPRLQFIVTTHSPLVCHAASHGSVFRLPRPGQDDDRAGFLVGEEYKRLVYGNILDAYGTEAFGQIHINPKAQAWTEELAKLNLRASTTALDAQELKRQRELQELLPQTNRAEDVNDKLDQLLSMMPAMVPPKGEP